MVVSLIAPAYNEQEALPLFYREVVSFFEQEKYKTYTLELVIVDDGSKDKTAEILTELAQKDSRICATFLSRNFGKEPALFAGLEASTGDVCIPIDVDLQDPIHVIPLLLEKHEEGFDVVLAKRTDRSSDSFLKRKTAEYFYKLHNKISDIQIEPNVGDFRLMSRRAVDEVLKISENQLFMKGLLSWVGFPTTIVEYKREERQAGRTKFNGWKLWNLAVEGITSFSLLPLKIWTYLGSIIALFSFLLLTKVIIKKIWLGEDVTGYSSLMAAVLFLGGVQLIGIGVLGEYLGRNYMESKKRPRYIIKNEK